MTPPVARRRRHTADFGSQRISRGSRARQSWRSVAEQGNSAASPSRSASPCSPKEARRCGAFRPRKQAARRPPPTTAGDLTIGKADRSWVQRSRPTPSRARARRSDGAASGAWGWNILRLRVPSVGVDREGRLLLHPRRRHDAEQPGRRRAELYAQLRLDATNGVNCDLDRARTGYTRLQPRGVRPRGRWRCRWPRPSSSRTLPVRPKQFLILDAPMLVRGFVKPEAVPHPEDAEPDQVYPQRRAHQLRRPRSSAASAARGGHHDRAVPGADDVAPAHSIEAVSLGAAAAAAAAPGAAPPPAAARFRGRGRARRT